MPRTINSLSFKGGYRFRGFQGAPSDELVEIAPGSRISIPVEPSDKPTVKNGDSVVVGQTVAENDGPPRRLTISPAKGSVVAVSDHAIQVECSGDQEWSPAKGATADLAGVDRHMIEDILLATGACCLAEGGLPTRHGTSETAPADIRRVVVHDSASEMYTASVSVLMRDRDSSHISGGMTILRKLYPKAECHVVMGAESKAFLEELGARTQSGAPMAHMGSPKYPQHRTAVVLSSLFRDKVPPNPTAADYGALVLDLQSLLQIRDAVVAGKPNIERIVALAGPGFQKPLHARVRIGTPVEHIVASRLSTDRSPRVVYNSVMTGAHLDDLSTPVGGDCSALIAIPKSGPEFLPFAKPGWRSDSYSFSFASALIRLPKTVDDNIHGEERACIGCGYCVEVCPVGILPFDLHRYVKRRIIDEKLLRYGAFRCIDCNLCTYVCASKIPLAHLIAEGKQALLDEGYSPVPAAESEENPE